MLQGILIIVFMLAIMALMVTRKMPTVLALFVLAIGICIIGGVPALGTDADGNAIGFMQTVIQAGAVRMGDAIFVAVFAAWVGMVMEKTRISETMIKKGAELGGDKTMVVALILFIVSSLLFSTVNGLGTVIMVGTIAIPILVSVGTDKFTASAVVLFAYCVGNNINLSNVNALAAIVGTSFSDTQLILGICSAGAVLSGLIFFVLHTRKTGRKYAFSAPAGEEETSLYEIKGVTGAMAMLTPVIPLVLVTVFKFPLIASFMIALLWACAFTSYKAGWKGTMNMLTKSLFDGVSATAPSVTQMVGLGMLLNAINHPNVVSAMEPVMRAITPTGAVGFILFFLILAPLCLYRGPLNMWGLGAGVAALMVSLNLLPINVIMGGFCAVSVMQLLCCPTNTHNVWVCGYTGEEVSVFARRMLPWIYPVVAVGLVVTVVLWM